MDKMKATTTDAGINKHDYCSGISVDLCGEFDGGTPKVHIIWATVRYIFARYIFGMSNDVTVAKQSTTSMYDLGVDTDRFRRLDLDRPVVDEKAETLRAMELATRMG
jgi:hypothetical protein